MDEEETMSYLFGNWSDAKPEPEPDERAYTALEMAMCLCDRGDWDKNTVFTLEMLSDLDFDIKYNNPKLLGRLAPFKGRHKTFRSQALQLMIDVKELDFNDAMEIVVANSIFDAWNKPLRVDNPDYFYIYGMGPAPYMKSFIDELYASNPELYYHHYKRSWHSGDQYRLFYPTEQMRTIEKMAGIVTYVRETGDKTPFNHLLQKGYKRLTRYVAQKDVLNYADIYKLWEKEQWRCKEIDEKMAYNRFVHVAVGLITESGKETKGMFRFYHELFDVLNVREVWQVNNAASEDVAFPLNRFKHAVMSEVNADLYKRFFFDGHVLNGVKRVIAYQKNRMEEQVQAELRKGRLPQLDDINFEANNPILTKIADMRELLSGYGIPVRFFDRTLTEQEWTYFFTHYWGQRVNGTHRSGLNEKEEWEYSFENLVPHVLLYTVARDFLDTRLTYLNDIDQSNTAELALLKEQEAVERAGLERKIADMQATFTQLDARFNERNELEKTLKRENTRLETELERMTEKEREAQERIAFLEEALTIQEEAEVLDENDIAELANKHVIVLAGRVDWAKKLQARHPDWEFVEAEHLTTRDMAFLDNPNAYVFFNYSYTGHAAYYRVKAAMNKYKLPLYPIGETKNVALTEKSMASAVRRFSPERIKEIKR